MRLEGSGTNADHHPSQVRTRARTTHVPVQTRERHRSYRLIHIRVRITHVISFINVTRRPIVQARARRRRRPVASRPTPSAAWRSRTRAAIQDCIHPRRRSSANNPRRICNKRERTRRLSRGSITVVARRHGVIRVTGGFFFFSVSDRRLLLESQSGFFSYIRVSIDNDNTVVADMCTVKFNVLFENMYN